MTTHTEKIQPNLFLSEDKPIVITTCCSSDTHVKALADLLAFGCGDIGISATFNDKCVLDTLAVSREDMVVSIVMKKGLQAGRKKKGGGKMGAPTTVLDILRDQILLNPNLVKLAFHMDRLSTSLYYDHKLFVSPAIDVQSVCIDKAPRHSNEALFQSLGGEHKLLKDRVVTVFQGSQGDGVADNEGHNAALRAWATWTITKFPIYVSRRLRHSVPIHTNELDLKQLALLSKFNRVHDHLQALKPVRVKNDVDQNMLSLDQDGNLLIQLERYKTRIRRSTNQSIVIETGSGGGTAQGSLTGRAFAVKGKQATVKFLQGRCNSDATITSVHTIGRDYTNAEQQRTSIILWALQETTTVLLHPLSQQIFFSAPPEVDPEIHSVQRPSPSIYYSYRPLNTSQSCAVQRILSEDHKHRICLIQGPPGSGKTTVIAAVVQSLIANPSYRVERSIWLVAQSNVAVKNMAEKLADVGFFDFKLIVSNEFHFEWHEHLYEKIEENVVVTDMLSDQLVTTERLLLGSRVILCTLGTLSSGKLTRAGVTRLVPLETVIVDEASQIEVSEYLPMIHLFGSSIHKLALVGDDKQLPPYGADSINNLQSIFEVKPLLSEAVFLAKQYRMPHPIGNFVSRKVYDGKLVTEHCIKNKLCCRFVNVHDGREAKCTGGSFKNEREAQAVLHIVKKFISQGKANKFRILTPYDGQRDYLEKMLKRENLPWEDKCFCVDSFQGNEADHIILSVVRSDRVGFLSNLRRSNVMLTRCKESMTICTSRRYLDVIARKTLLGEMAAEWCRGEPLNTPGGTWISLQDVLNGNW